MLDELHLAFADADDLDRILTSGSNLIDTLDESWPQTLRTLENARTVLRTGVDSKSQFVELSSSLQSLTASLKDYDPKLRTILDKTPAQVAEIRELTATLSRVLPNFLTAADDLTGLLEKREPHLRALLTDFPRGLQQLSRHDRRGLSCGSTCWSRQVRSAPTASTRSRRVPPSAQPVVPGRGCSAERHWSAARLRPRTGSAAMRMVKTGPERSTVILGTLVAALVAVLAFVLLRGGDDDSSTRREALGGGDVLQRST